MDFDFGIVQNISGDDEEFEKMFDKDAGEKEEEGKASSVDVQFLYERFSAHVRSAGVNRDDFCPSVELCIEGS